MNGELDDIEILAAEYVLGTLDSEQLRQAETRLATDREFARLVDEWSRRLAPLSEAVAPVEPSRDIWPAIEAALPAERRPAAAPPRPASIWERVGFWRWATASALAIAAALAIYIGVAPALQRAPETRYVAVLESGPGNPAWLVNVDIEAEEITVRPLGDLTLADQSYELWLVPGSSAQPRSLGLITAGSDRTVPISAELGTAVPQATAFAVSLEPAGGSPTGQPTGPVLYQGSILPVANPDR